MPKRRLVLLAASIAAVHTAAASAISIDQLLARQSSCLPSFFRCENAKFPDYFCCKGRETCISLAGDTTLLCCPEGSDCQRIRPVPCDLELQDGEANPDAVIKTTALGGTLPRCGSQCCPFGYSCVDGQCAMDENQNAVPIQTTTTTRPEPTTSTTTTTTTRGGVKTTTSADDASPTTEPTETAKDPGATDEPSAEDETGSSSGPPVAAIAGGATAAGVVLIGAAAALAFYFWKKKKKQEGQKKKGRSPLKLSRSTSSFGNLISRPVMASNSADIDNEDAFVRPPCSAAHIQELEPDSVTGAVLSSSITSPEAGAMPPAHAAAVLAAQPHGQSSRGAYGGYGRLEPSEYVDMPYADYERSAAPVPQPPRQNTTTTTTTTNSQNPNSNGNREPSSASIDVFADPDIAPGQNNGAPPRYSNMTSFTQMLDSAGMGGVGRGEPYLDYGRDGGLAAPSWRR
ncbi:hypothetical protein VTH06DRAFT_8078 [Thermothelomyces fergusii]